MLGYRSAITDFIQTIENVNEKNLEKINENLEKGIFTFFQLIF